MITRLHSTLAGTLLTGAACILLTTQSSIVWASTAPDDFPAKPPADLPVKAFKLPKSVTRKLSNGLKVVFVENDRLPLVTVRMSVPAGSINDPSEAPGLASAVAGQLTAGTDRYTSLQLREEAEKLGGSIGISAGSDYATVSGSALSENYPQLISLLSNVLLHPTFPEDELKIFKGLALQGLVVQRQNPGFLAQEQLQKALYGSHPYSVTASNAAAINSFSPEKLRAFYEGYYTPQGSVLIVTGAVKPEIVFSIAEKAFENWNTTGSSTTAMSPGIPVNSGKRIVLVNRPGSVQSNILFGNRAIKRTDPDFYPVAVANMILGGGSASRLFGNIREKLGYAYDVNSIATPRALAGEFTLSAQTRTAVTADALKEMLKEEERIRTSPVSDNELRSAKNLLNGSFVITLTSQSGVADRLLTVEAYGLPADYISTFRDKINAVTAADVQRVAQKYFQSDKPVIVVVGDAEKLRDSLKAIADVEEAK